MTTDTRWWPAAPTWSPGSDRPRIRMISTDHGVDLDDPHISRRVRRVTDHEVVNRLVPATVCDDRGTTRLNAACLRRRGIAREAGSKPCCRGRLLRGRRKILNRICPACPPQVFDRFSVDGLVGGSTRSRWSREDRKEGGRSPVHLESRAVSFCRTIDGAPGAGSLLACGRLQRWEQRQRGRGTQ